MPEYAAAVGPAGASECYSIKDYDKRLECLAVERRSPEGCTSIKNPDDRVLCRQRAGQRSLSGWR